ncbi:MAG: CaiB/BaiF CoA transferase family protein [Dehalococcoidia bacterium]
MAALDGMKVLDLTQYEAGTTSTQYLAWLGATVYKVEKPGRGDPGRRSSSPDPRDGLYFLSFNSNKKSVAIDLEAPEGRDLFLQLVPKVDAVVENFTLGTMEKLGLGYDVLKAANPAIIYCTVKGFGTTGPYAGFKSFDWVAQAAGGGFSVTGEKDGPPMRPGATHGDTGTGMHAAMGTIAAYVEKLRTGKGQVVEISMQETMVNFMKMQMSTRERHDPNPIPRSGLGLGPTMWTFPCTPGGSNDYVFIMCVTDRMWDSLVMAIDRPDLAADERFDSWPARAANAAALIEEISKWTRQRTKFEAMEHLGARDVPSSATYDTNDIFDDKHLKARGAIITIDHPERGAVRLPGPVVRLSNSDVKVVAAPLLGQHTAEVLGAELGMDAAKVQGLAAAGVLGTRGD